ncbi:MAG TPA: PAS domain S-box protein, partial [Smithellaceae bacterium]|nr:PAS domain S-box protein [Smithellaceae bacterium]
NALYRTLTGYSDEELLHRNSLEYIHPEDRDKTRENAIAALKGERSEPYEYRFIKKNGDVMWILERVASIFFEGTRAALGSFMDITERKQMETTILQSEEKYRTILENIEDGYAEMDLKGNLLFFNESLCRMQGYSREELVGLNYRRLMDEENAAKMLAFYNKVYTTGESGKEVQYEIITKDGARKFIESFITPIKNDAGRIISFRGILRDRTRLKQAEEALRQSEERYRSILEETDNAYFEVDLAGNYTFVNDAVCHLMGYTKEELIGQTFRKQVDEEDTKILYDAFGRIYTTGEPVRGIFYKYARKDGSTHYAEIAGLPLCNPQGAIIGFRGIGRDITEHKKSEERIQYLATHDGLTGLPNRVLFSQLLNHAVQSAKRYQRIFAVFFIDLDRFKMINDTLGHDAGDQLLREIAVRFKQTLRAVDTVARLGGDEFVVLIEEIEDLSYVAAVARKILSAVMRSMTIMDKECRVTASIGVSIYPKDGEDEQSLMKNADIAMYFAKEEGKNNYKLYSNDIKSQSVERLSIETNLRSALERNEFFLQYQARFDVRTDEINGVEALLRWENPDLGILMPARFISVADDSGMIVPIGRWVLRTACFQNVAWQKIGLPPVCMSVNLSVRQLTDDHLIDDIQRALRDSGLDPRLLELEITEAMIMHRPVRMMAIFDKIKKLGVRIAIDNFGTGYSSLAQIRHFPVDTLKIDRCFIRDIMENPEDISVARAILSMGRTLSLTIVAEGVETEEQMAFLQEHACDEMQGFHFSKPVAPDQFADLLRNHLPFSRKSRK